MQLSMKLSDFWWINENIVLNVCFTNIGKKHIVKETFKVVICPSSWYTLEISYNFICQINLNKFGRKNGKTWKGEKTETERKIDDG